jgi:peroxiredoxin Q/BCP
MALEIGNLAPDFSIENIGNEIVKLSDFRGKWVVLYFYPKDDTSSCTKEACSFRDNMERITNLGAVVLGVSPDNLKSHIKFKDKFNLNFSLVPDSDKSICTSYDVIGEKSMFGKKYFGVIRSTYIISPEGKIAEVYSKVKVDKHVDTVIKRIIELKGE